MNTIIIEGVQPWDGSYPFDITDENLKRKEWRWIKQLAGYLPLQLWDGLQGGDADIFAVFAVITLHRLGKLDDAGVQELWERLSDAPLESVRVEFADDPADQEEPDAGPPARSSNGNEPSSGAASSASSETSEPPPTPSGTRGSATSTSPRPLSVT